MEMHPSNGTTTCSHTHLQTCIKEKLAVATEFTDKQCQFAQCRDYDFSSPWWNSWPVNGRLVE
jgi:hypothetical protein